MALTRAGPTARGRCSQRPWELPRLTTAAHVLLDHADALYVRWEAAKAELAAHVDGAAGPLRLCGFPSGLVGLLAPAAAHLAKAHPDLVVSVTEAEAADCFDRLLTDQGIAAGLAALGEVVAMGTAP